MNCNPGELAVIVRATDKHEKEWIGRVVRVTHLVGKGLDGTSWCWGYEGRTLIHPIYGSCTGISDRSLRPIRPGDISDEEVRDLYLPKVTEAA